MLDTESRYVARELEDYLLFSLSDLKERLSKAHSAIDQAEEQLHTMIGSLPDREGLAIRCLMARDFWHIAMLYRTVLARSPKATESSELTVEHFTTAEQPRSILPFKQTLFD